VKPVKRGNEARRAAAKFPLTDLGNAERFAATYHDKLQFDRESGHWLAWDGSRWVRNGNAEAMRLMGVMVRSIADDAGTLEQSAADQARKWAHTSESRAKLSSAMELAKSQPQLDAATRGMDADTELFNVQNGTLDLSTGKLRPHDPSDLITVVAPVRFDADAKCPRFEEFLQSTFCADAELIAYVQRAVGMCLSGDVSEQVMFILHGCGANGKSVLIDAVFHVLGAYAGTAPPSLLTQTAYQEHPTEFADLRGKRLVMASELEAGARLKWATVKRLTGDELIKARRMRHDFFEFKRTNKLFLVTNHLPKVEDSSEAVWRRVRVIPFTHVVPIADRDARLLDKLRAEASGILNWLLAGYAAWRQCGLGVAGAVDAASRDYRHGKDSVARFFHECCVDGRSSAAGGERGVTWKQLADAYEAWCRSVDLSSVGPMRLGSRLTAMGFPSSTSRVGGKTAKVRLGLWLKQP
jgi:putative DNA primase/helicase